MGIQGKKHRLLLVRSTVSAHHALWFTAVRAARALSIPDCSSASDAAEIMICVCVGASEKRGREQDSSYLVACPITPLTAYDRRTCCRSKPR